MLDPSTSRKTGGVSVMVSSSRPSFGARRLVAQPVAWRKVLAMVLCLVQASDQGDFLSMLCY
jgi:hypothetical protein